MKPDGTPNDLGDLLAVGTTDAGKIPVVDANGKFILANPWPIGSLFIAAVSTSPATLLGFGTWAAFGAGRVLVGRDAGQTEFDTLEETGGAKTHTLTEAEMPAHTHAAQGLGAGTENYGYGAAAASSVVSGATGGGGAHNNLQPYIVVYMWKRTA
jgi:hypothetical protein